MTLRGCPPLFALLLLVGCLSPAADTVDSPEAADVTVVTSPDDYSMLDNGTTVDGSHLHDYWGGRERLVVMEETQEGGAGLWFGGVIPTNVFRGGSGQVVPQGTALVEVTLSWTKVAGDSFGPPELWVKTAEDNEAWQYGPINSGETVRIESTNARNDLPHQLLSAWAFEFRVGPEAEATPARFQGQVSIRVEAIRGLDIPLFPAHPDRWQGGTSLQLFQASAELSYMGDSDGGWSCFGGCPVVHTPADGVVVPFDATHVEVVLEMDGALPTRLGLSVHGANQREYVDVTPAENGDVKRVYHVPVERGMGDGPYAIQSLWEFLPYIQEPTEDGYYRGSYTITATAHKMA